MEGLLLAASKLFECGVLVAVGYNLRASGLLRASDGQVRVVACRTAVLPLAPGLVAGAVGGNTVMAAGHGQHYGMNALAGPPPPRPCLFGNDTTTSRRCDGITSQVALKVAAFVTLPAAVIRAFTTCVPARVGRGGFVQLDAWWSGLVGAWVSKGTQI